MTAARFGEVVTVLAGCTACGACLPTCPPRALRVAPSGASAPLTVLEDLCTGCGECVEVCPAEAIVPCSEASSASADALPSVAGGPGPWGATS